MAKKQKKVILITGAKGNIGTKISNILKNQYEIVGCDLKDNKPDISMDLSSDDSVKLAFKIFQEKYGTKIAAVIHLAAYFDFTGEESPLYKKINEEGSVRLLKSLQDFEVERFIFTSTMLVHNPCKPGEKINEKTKLNPKWAYPISKLETEEVIKKNHGHIPYVILRLAGIYDNTSCIPTLSHQIARIYERDFKSHLYAGDVKAGQSLIHLDDVAELIKKVVERRNEIQNNEVILAGEPEAISYKNLQENIGRLIHNEQGWNTLTIPSVAAKTGSWLEQKMEPIIPDDLDQGEKPFIKPFMIELGEDHYALDISKAKKNLDWEPKHSIIDTLPKIISSLKQKPKQWYEKNHIKVPDWMQVIKKSNPEKVRTEYENQVRYQHKQNLWAHFINIALGFWLITSPSTLGYESTYLGLSDVISGILVIVLGFICLSWEYVIARWVTAAVGFWLIFAPLIFWAPTAASYLNDTLIGSLIIGFAVLTRPDAGVAVNAALKGPRIPFGWQFSPSSWFQRTPIIILAFVGLFISRYLTAYQLGHINSVWEPFFMGNPQNVKNGTEEIITSFVSKAWPVPDAGLGAVTYLLEILTGLIGGENRWRTMPWLVLLFGIMIIPLGAVSITFIIIQPIVLDTWCTLCLIAAAAMLLQIPYSFDEIVATSTFLWRRYKAGRPVLRVLFVGDTEQESTHDKNQQPDNFEQSPSQIIKEMLTGGITLPWNLLLCIIIGIWLMFTRLTLGSVGSLANAEHFIGAMVITVTITAFAEVMRPVRFINMLFAFFLLAVGFMYDATPLNLLFNIALAIALFLFSIPRGRVKNSYGDWDKVII